MKSIVARRDATETTEGAATAVAALPNADPVHGAAIGALMPLYVVIFIGFVGYSLMITVFTPMLLRADTAMLPVESTMPYRTVMLGVLLCLYPLGQFFGSPILGSRSDRFGDGRYCSFHYVRRRHAMPQSVLRLPFRTCRSWALRRLWPTLRKATSSSHRGDCRHRLAHTAQSLLRLYLWRAVSPTSSVRSVGGKLADPTLVPWFSDATPFWASFALLVLTTLTVLVLFREARAHHQPRRLRLLETFGSLLQVFANPQLRRYYIVNFPLYLAIFGFFRSYPMYLVDRFHLNVSRAFRSSWPGWVCRSCSPISG